MPNPIMQIHSDRHCSYTPAIQTWRYVADRTGILCYANLPMLWMFSGRNNVFMWATGWSFSTFNTFHRNIARVATIQAIVHSIGWSAIEGNCKCFHFPSGIIHDIDKAVCLKMAIFWKIGKRNTGTWVAWYVFHSFLAIAICQLTCSGYGGNEPIASILLHLSASETL